MALWSSQVLIFNPSRITNSSDSIRFVNPLYRFVSLCRRSLDISKHLSVRISSVGRAATIKEYVYPDPDPKFAEVEVAKFRGEILKKLAKEKEEYGDSLNAVVNVCVQVLSDFLLNEYGGPGTFVVEPFTYILVSLKEKKLPGAPLAARTSLLWAQKYLDEDWKAWISFHNI